MSSFALRIARSIILPPSSDGGARLRMGLGGRRWLGWTHIAIGLAVMILSVAIVVGFKQQIQDKIARFGGHLQVLALASNRTFEKQPICCSDSLLTAIGALPEVAEAKPFITKPAVLKTDGDFLSVVARSASDSLEENEIEVSRTIADKLQLQVGSRLKLFFVKSSEGFEFGSETASVKSRTMTVARIFQTHFNEFDSQMIQASHSFLQQVSDWDEDMASGIAIRLNGFEALDESYMRLIDIVSQHTDRRGTALYVQSIEQLNPQIFGWLDLLDTNVWVILALMLAVASFTMISGLLIIILENTALVGTLKALGATNWQLQKVFLYVAGYLTLVGLVVGNVAGLGLCAIQYYWQPIALDAENYYLDAVPIALEGWHLLALNAGTLAITLLVMLLPTALVSRIAPYKTIQTE